MKIKRFTIAPENLEKWMHQNGAVLTGDCVEGVLLDSFVVATKHGYAAIYEHYINAWMSDYLVEFQRGEAQDVFNRWYDFEERANRETA